MAPDARSGGHNTIVHLNPFMQHGVMLRLFLHSRWLPVPALAALLLSGCTEFKVSNPSRSATEQLLISTAADRAVNSTGLNLFAQKKVYLDGTYFDGYDSKYVLGTIRDALSRAGALLVNEATNSEIVIEARSGGLSVDASESLVGIPTSGAPTPLAGALQIPELAFYKSGRQDSIAKLALLAYSTKTREHVFSSGPVVGRSYNKYYSFMGLIHWTTTDIPEKNNNKAARLPPASPSGGGEQDRE